MNSNKFLPRHKFDIGSFKALLLHPFPCLMGQERLEETRERIEAAIIAPFEPYLHDPVVKDAAERFHLEWVQEEGLEGADVELVAR